MLINTKPKPICLQGVLKTLFYFYFRHSVQFWCVWVCSGVKNFILITFKILLTGSFMLCPVVQWISAAASQCHYFCPECQVSSSYYFFSIFSNTVSPIKNVLWKVFRKRPNQGLYSWQDKSIKIFFPVINVPQCLVTAKSSASTKYFATRSVDTPTQV